MVELFLVRHGESLRNVACKLAHQGAGEALREQLGHRSCEAQWPLTDKGRRQASMAGWWIGEQGSRIDAVYSSPYLRAWETAQRLHLGLDVAVDDRLREREWGEFLPGQYSAEEYVADLAECWGLGWKSRFPGAESIYDLMPSTTAFLDELQARHGGGAVVVVTHGGRMQSFEHLLEQTDPPRRYPNCSVLQYRFERDGTFVRVGFPAQSGLAPIEWQRAQQAVRMRA